MIVHARQKGMYVVDRKCWFNGHLDERSMCGKSISSYTSMSDEYSLQIQMPLIQMISKTTINLSYHQTCIASS